MYCCVSIVDAILHHSFAIRKKKYYHHKNEKHGRVKYVYIIMSSDEVELQPFDLFRQVRYHQYFGKSRFGAIPDGIIKIEMSDESESFEDAIYSLIKVPNVVGV